jgi:hypothetical protein
MGEDVPRLPVARQLESLRKSPVLAVLSSILVWSEKVFHHPVTVAGVMGIWLAYHSVPDPTLVLLPKACKSPDSTTTYSLESCDAYLGTK